MDENTYAEIAYEEIRISFELPAAHYTVPIVLVVKVYGDVFWIELEEEKQSTNSREDHGREMDRYICNSWGIYHNDWLEKRREQRRKVVFKCSENELHKVEM